jgi:hypothetical protein
MKPAMIVLSILLMIGVALFWKQVWGIFAGMTVLEAMNTIVTFILHVAVATIAAYAVMLIPEYIKPWMKALRWKRRQARKARRQGRANEPTVQRIPKLNANSMLLSLLARQMGSPTPRPPSASRQKQFDEGATEEPRIDLKF